MDSSFLHGTRQSNLLFSSSQFSHLLSPAILLSNENKIYREETFHEMQTKFPSKVTFVDCTFTYCSPSEENTVVNGGAIAITTDVEFEAKNCLFRKNSAHKSGGAIYIEQSRVTLIENCMIADNECQGNGALHVCHCEKIDVKSTNFTLNRSKMVVGAVNLEDISDRYEFDFCSFCENSARMSATINTHKSRGNIFDCLFYYNKIYKGVQSIRAVNDVILKIERTTFSDEKTPSIEFTSGSELEITKCRFAHSEHDEIDKDDCKVFNQKENSFNQNTLPYEKIVLPPLKPLYDNEDDFKQIAADTTKLKVNKTESKDDDNEFVKNNNDEIVNKNNGFDNNNNNKLFNFVENYKKKDLSQYSSVLLILAILFVVVILLFLCLRKKRPASRGFANIDQHQKGNPLYNDTNIYQNEPEITDVKFQLNENDDLPDEKMDKL